MQLLRSLQALLEHQVFRRLLVVRIATQFGDGLVQVGMLSYALFSPQHQPTGWAIVAVLAINYLPFSLIAPFVAPLLDRWPRQRSAIITDVIRTVLCVGVALLVLNQNDSAAEPMLVYLVLLLVMGLNRFVLAGLAAGLAETVTEDKYLHASAVIPVIGPITMVIAGIFGGAIRVFLDPVLSTNVTNAIVFGMAALTFTLSVVLLTRIGKHELGPSVSPAVAPTTPNTASSKAGTVLVEPTAAMSVWDSVVDSLRYLRTRPIVVQGLKLVAVERTGYGLLMTVTILAYRNTFHQTDDIAGAIADMGVWFIASGVGFTLSGVAAPLVAARLKVRNAMLAVMCCSALFQAVPGSIFVRPTLVVAAFLGGICIQSIKVYTDTLTQAHIEDAYRGRVFMLYDIINNVSLVVGALIAAIAAPVTGLSLPVYLGLAGWFLLAAVWFARVSASNRHDFDKGSPFATV